MACALFIPGPERIVQLGLGAAALTKFCYRNLPSASITVVEISEQVIDTARRSFALPADDERLEVVQADAREYLGDRRRAGRADWLQVDLYDAAARGPVFDDPAFYALCRRALRRPGVACFNLFGSRFDPSFRAICEAFDDRVLVLAPGRRGQPHRVRPVRTAYGRAHGRRGKACAIARSGVAPAACALVAGPEGGQRPRRSAEDMTQPA